MFEEQLCLFCRGPVPDESHAYCSQECKANDSGQVSSSSSPALHDDVPLPALIPSSRSHQSRYSVSSSSASSSTAWSDDEPDDDSAFSAASDCDSADPEAPSKPSGYLNPLSYARRPSGTNNGSLLPHLQTPPSLPHGHVRSAPPSAPIHFRSLPSTDDDDNSDFGSSSRDEYQLGYPRTAPDHQNKSTITKARRSRNRASLPAYFSLLQISSPSSSQPTISTSPGHKPSPPTPKLSLAALATGISHAATAPPTTTTPRGRRRDARIDRFPSSSSERSSSPPAEVTPSIPQISYRARLESRGSKGSKSSVEQLFDWSSEQPVFPRGRRTVRRNSSPPQKILLGMNDFISLPAHRQLDSKSTSRPPEHRGRMKTDELDGIGGGHVQAPGFGHGRSGIVDRERDRRLGFR